MYKVTVTANGTTATASKCCHTIKEARDVKEKLSQILKMPVQIDIMRISGTR